FIVPMADEQVRRERHAVAQLPAEQIVHRPTELLAEDVEAGELEGGEDLRAVVVERCGRVRDLEAHLLELRRIVADEVTLHRPKRRLRRFTAAAHLAESSQAVVGIDLNDRADETSPVA